MVEEVVRIIMLVFAVALLAAAILIICGACATPPSEEQRASGIIVKDNSGIRVYILEDYGVICFARSAPVYDDAIFCMPISETSLGEP